MDRCRVSEIALKSDARELASISKHCRRPPTSFHQQLAEMPRGYRKTLVAAQVAGLKLIS